MPPSAVGLTLSGGVATFNNPLVIRRTTVISRFLSHACAHTQAKRERRKEARPGELLAAALTLFVEKGYAATRVEEVARLAGVSKGTLFLYFTSKEELFKAVVRENIVGRFAEWTQELEDYQGTSDELLRYAMLNWWERVGNTPVSGISKLMMSEAANFPELAAFYQTEVIEPGNQLIRRILQRGVDRGEFRDLDLDQAIYLVMAPMMYLISWKYSFGRCTSVSTPLIPEQYLALQIETLIRGLSANAPAQP